MKWTVLGCHSPYPGPGGATPGYLLDTGSAQILIDCGSGVLSQLGKWMDPWSLDAVVLSHLHNDHAVDIPILHYALLMAHATGARTEKLPIYAPGQPKELADRLTYKDYIQFIDLNALENDQTRILGADFQFLKTQHDIDCYGMKISLADRNICYTADTGPDTDWSKVGKNIDLLVVEGTYLTRDVPQGIRGHLTVAEAAKLAEQLQAKKCLITHLYPLYNQNEILGEARSYYQGELFIAELGLQIEV